jgi:hypothetical protein
MDRATLRELLTSHFNLEEIETLCFDLHIDFENLDGRSKQAKVREILLYCERNRQLDELVAAVQRLRPNLIDPAKLTPSPAATRPSELAPSTVARPVNLSFDARTIADWPSGWSNSLGFVDGVSVGYEARVVARDDQLGSCVMFQNVRAADSDFGSLMQRCPAKHLAGQALRLEAEIKTEQVKRWAGLWLRADGEEVPGLVFDNMSRRPIHGSTPWTKYTIDVQLPQETVWLNYGLILAGPGMMWATNFRVMVWLPGRTWQDV